uniref:Endothelin-1 n=1 Tax=Junco hyemalis TaxID=40217 RepID=A0A8C5NS26_JUNHY
MDYCHMIVSLLFVLCPGSAAPSAAPGAEADAAPPPAAAAHRRARRCSCSSLMDEECVYFCHLDIIWINTPEKTVPYGLGGPARPRRSLKDVVPEMLAEPSSRCRCTNQKDRKCLNFCQAGKDLWCVSCCYSLKGNACERDGLWCTYSFWHLLSECSPQSLAIGNSIKASFSIAKLKAELQKGRKLKHNRASKRQSVRESLKAS